jgi:hypothetical protein
LLVLAAIAVGTRWGWGRSAGVHRGGVSAPRGVAAAAPFDPAMHLLQLSRCWAECLGLYQRLISHPLEGMLESGDFHCSGGGGSVCCGSSGGGELRQRQRWQLRLARQCAVNEAHSVISADTQIAHVADRLRRSATYQNLPCKLPNVLGKCGLCICEYLVSRRRRLRWRLRRVSGRSTACSTTVYLSN